MPSILPSMEASCITLAHHLYFLYVKKVKNANLGHNDTSVLTKFHGIFDVITKLDCIHTKFGNKRLYPEHKRLYNKNSIQTIFIKNLNFQLFWKTFKEQLALGTMPLC